MRVSRTVSGISKMTLTSNADLVCRCFKYDVIIKLNILECHSPCQILHGLIETCKMLRIKENMWALIAMLQLHSFNLSDSCSLFDDGFENWLHNVVG